MGYVPGPAGVGDVCGGGLGIIGSATMTLDCAATAIAEVKERTDAPFGVNLRADAPDAAERIELMIAEQVRVASFALAPRQDMISG